MTRGHQFKLAKKQHRLKIRSNSFSLRVIDSWNALPGHVVMAPSLNCFKSRLKIYGFIIIIIIIIISSSSSSSSSSIVIIIIINNFYYTTLSTGKQRRHNDDKCFFLRIIISYDLIVFQKLASFSCFACVAFVLLLQICRLKKYQLTTNLCKHLLGIMVNTSYGDNLTAS